MTVLNGPKKRLKKMKTNHIDNLSWFCIAGVWKQWGTMRDIERKKKCTAKIQIHNSPGGIEAQLYLWTYELYLLMGYDEFYRLE